VDDETHEGFMKTFLFLQRFDCIPAIEVMFKKFFRADWETESVEVNKSLIVLFLRTNYSIRWKIESYGSITRKAVRYLKNNNINPESVLRGVI